jgi:hypothetical protein
VRWKTTSLIGGTCTAREGLSESVLMHEGLIYLQRILFRLLILFSFKRTSDRWDPFRPQSAGSFGGVGTGGNDGGEGW